MTGEFPAQMASNEENASIWWRLHWHDQLFLKLSFLLYSSIEETEKLCENYPRIGMIILIQANILKTSSDVTVESVSGYV